jgi:cell division protein FtsB
VPAESIDQNSPTETPLTWVVAMIFWLLLLIVTVLYGAVALAPKLLIFSDLNDDAAQLQARLVHLERQVNELRKVVDLLENDPQVIRELARIDLDAAQPDEERIAIGPELILQSRLTTPSPLTAEVTRAWYSPFLKSFATNHKLRVTSLSVAAVLVLVSFTFFHPSQVRSFSFGWSNLMSAPRQFFARYRD